MKRYSNLFTQIVAPQNIYSAYLRASKRKLWQNNVRYVEENLCVKLKEIHLSLINRSFTTSKYKIKTIYEPKQREIYILPFYPDRIIQHAIMNIIAPIWDKLFIYDSYACRQGKGQHAASKRLMGFIRQNSYYYQADISKFYPSINHKILFDIIQRKIKCKETLHLLKDIIDSIDSDCNVPIGNYTSQWFGNLYLNELDQYLKHSCKAKYYIRYNDDFVVLSNSKSYLQDIRGKIREFCKDRLCLTVTKEKLRPTKLGIDFVGYVHFKKYILLRKRTAKRVKKKIKTRLYQYCKGIISKEQFRSSLNGIKGWAKHCNSYNFRKSIRLDELLEG